MTSARKKLKAQSNRLPNDHVTRRSANSSTCFKIYRDGENVKARDRSLSNRTNIFIPAGGKASSTIENNIKGNQKQKNSQSMYACVVKSKINVKRNALADVSNIQRSFSRKTLYDAPKPMIPIGRVKIDGSSTSSRKVVMGKLKANESKGVSNFRNLKQGGAKGTNAYLVDQKSNAQHRASVNFSRKSFPVLRRIDKENDQISQKDKEKYKSYVTKKADHIVVHEVSHVKSGISRNRASDGFILKVPKFQSMADASVLSRKATRGKSMVGLRKDVRNLPNLKHDTKDAKAVSCDQRIKDQDSAQTNICRTSRRNASLRSRISLPVLKKVDKLATNFIIKNMTIPEKSKGNCKSYLHKDCHAKPGLRKNRASHGFIPLVPKTKAKASACALSRKVMRPIQKISVATSNASAASIANSALVSNSLLPIAAISIKENDGASTSTVYEKMTPLAHKGPLTTQGEVISIPISVGRKSGRRKSFTSSLVKGSKMLENSEIMKQCELPTIDDSSNHLEVSEYVNDIYQHYWASEIHNTSLVDIMKLQTEITPEMRGILINWLIEVHLRFELSQETLFLTVTLLDQYLLNVPIKNYEMQLVGLTALFIASKYEDFWYPMVADLISISVECYTKDEVLNMEKAILNKLKFRLSLPTAYVFMTRFLKAAQADKVLKHLAFYLIELCLVEYEAVKLKPSLLSAGAVYLARLTLKMSPPWTPLLSKHLRYDESQIRECGAMILRFHKAAKDGKLNVTRKKFERRELSCVADLKPLDGLIDA